VPVVRQHRQDHTRRQRKPIRQQRQTQRPHGPVTTAVTTGYDQFDARRNRLPKISQNDHKQKSMDIIWVPYEVAVRVRGELDKLLGANMIHGSLRCTKNAIMISSEVVDDAPNLSQALRKDPNVIILNNRQMRVLKRNHPSFTPIQPVTAAPF
jgi:hypothetical protein